MNRHAGFQPVTAPEAAGAQTPPSGGAPPTPPDKLIHSILIDPSASSWQSSLSPRPIPPRARRFREQLGLPTDAPLIMTGHQAAFWHAGILAKYLAADAATRAFGARTAWIVVDQDANDFAAIRYPVRTTDNRLATRTWLLTRRGLIGPDGQPLPTGSIPPFTPEPLPVPGRGERFAAESVQPGLHAIREALLRHAREAASAADQIRRAMDDLLAPFTQTAPSVFATHFARTDLFREVVDRMRDDPAACIRAYNAAVAAHPHARMTTLAHNDTQYIYELPLWRIDPTEGGQRRRVYAEELDDIPLEQVAPRAALMTGLLRLADSGGCELFIAGTGGGGERGYERVAEQWLQSWLGETLAAEAVVSATVHLNMGERPVTDVDVAHALWRAHRAPHDPALLGDVQAAKEKMSLVRQIEEERLRGEDPSATYRRMHRLLEQVRAERSDALEAVASHAARHLARRRDAAILTDRTWPFPLHAEQTITTLQRHIDDRFV